MNPLGRIAAVCQARAEHVSQRGTHLETNVAVHVSHNLGIAHFGPEAQRDNVKKGHSSSTHEPSRR